MACSLPTQAQEALRLDSLPTLPDSVLLPPDTADIRPISMAENGVKPDSVRADSTLANAQKMALAADSIVKEFVQLQRPKFVPDPIRAMWLGLILPGGGQIYNKKYWKLPIIYGGFLGCAYALSWNNQMLNDYSQAYLDIMDDDPNTQSYMKMLPLNYNISGRESQFQEIFKNKKNYYRKYRDMSIFAFAAVYVLAVIDGYVDAELSTFDISRDLSLHLSPAIVGGTESHSLRRSSRGHQAETGVGLACSLSF